MKKLTAGLLVLFSFTLIVLSCSKEQGKKDANTASKPKKEFEMREMSEMALIMRSMELHMVKWQAAFSNNSLPNRAYPKEFVGFAKANMTDGFNRDDRFNELAIEFEQRLDSFKNNSSLSGAKGEYKLLVESCITCHDDYCSGVSSRLEKLKLPE